MSHILYDKEKVLEIIAEYLTTMQPDTASSLPAAALYDNVVRYAAKKHKHTAMPKFAQARKLIIAALSEADLYHTGERFTSEVIGRMQELYYPEDDIDNILRYEYNILCYSGEVIVCTVPLRSVHQMRMLTGGISAEKEKSDLWGKINTIQQTCTRIKKEDPNNILAVIPEFNRMVYLNGSGKIKSDMDELDPLCDKLCMFVKNTPEGQAFVEKMEHLPHSLIDSAEDGED